MTDNAEKDLSVMKQVTVTYSSSSMVVTPGYTPWITFWEMRMASTCYEIRTRSGEV
jgi:hypothetical protein